MPSSNLAAVTSLVPTVLCATQLAVTTSVAVYTCSANTGTIIKQGSLCNVTTLAVTVSVSVIPSGAAVDGTHRVLNSYSLAANDTLPLGDYLAGTCLGPGDAVHVIAGTANAVDVVLSGMVNG